MACVHDRIGRQPTGELDRGLKPETETRAWLAIFAAGAALRLAGLGASAIWYDEAITYLYARLPLLDTVRVAAIDYPGPLLYLIEWPFAHLARNEIILRLPSLLASIASLWLARELGRELRLDRVATLAGVGALAVLPYQLWMAQDARFYALLNVLLLGAALYGLRGRWLGLAACVGLAMLLHPIAPFYLAAVGILIVVWRYRPSERWRQLLRPGAAFVGGAAAWLPWAPVFTRQLAQDFWLRRMSLGNLWLDLHLDLFVRTLPFWWEWWALLMFPFWAALALANTLIERRRAMRALAWLAIGPVLFMWLYALVGRPVAFYRTLSGATIPLALWFAGAVVALWRLRPRAGQFAASIWIALLIAGLAGWNTTERGGALRTYAEFIRSEWRPGDVVYHATGTTQAPFAFYLEGSPNYSLNTEQHRYLMGQDMKAATGLAVADLDRLQWRRAWLVYAQDPLIPWEDVQRVEGYIERYNGVKVGRVQYWQAAEIDIYLLERS